jgi:hypothetical protein
MPVQTWLHRHAVILYLHGFASSARSSKAAFFASKLEAIGLEFQIPDFNEPEFSTLTVTRMIGQVLARIDARPREPIALIGSSLGGFVAVQTAMQRPERIDRMVLLAPALDFNGNRLRDLGDRGVEEWERTDCLNVFHYGFGRTMPLHYALYADAGQYNCENGALSIPIQIFQGRRDTAVDPQSVERWAAARPNVELHLLDDDHQLAASLDYIWSKAGRFLTEGVES